jgi:Carboxypeptidase regulatory-like domain/TonB-dependent Receptor Plug Domain/TonB dependent receptor
MKRSHCFIYFGQSFAFLFWLVCAVLPGQAQVSTGTILGSVTDSANAAVANATVTVRDAETNIAHETVTNSQGYYSLPNLQTGNYEVAVEASGFSEEVSESVALTVGAEQEVDFALKVGSITQKVVVTGNAAPVEMISSTVRPVVDQKTIVQLPLNGRDWAQLAILEPGVVPAHTQPAVAVSNQRANRGLGNQLGIGGARPQENNYRVDGISINDYSNGAPGGVIGLGLGVDAIEEFSVVTSNAAADYGKMAGGVINAVTRAGTNAYHGEAYEFLRNSALDARNEFDNPGQIAPFRRNQFGAAFGGPIIKDRTFVFGDYEGLRQYQAANVASNVPSPAARNGQLVAGPVTVSPAVAPYLQFYPLPNSTINGDIGTFLFNDPQTTHENYFTIRGDHNISGKDTLTGTYFWDSGTLVSPDPFNVRVTGNIAKRQLATVGESHAFSTAVLNSAHFGYSRVVSIAPTTLSAINPAAADTSLGFVPGLPVGLINIGGVSNFQGGLYATGQFSFHYNSYQVYDDVDITHGKHSIKTGFAFERLQNNQLGTSNPNGQYIFSSLTTFLTNKPTSFNAPLSNGVSPRDLRQSVFGVYVTDDYRVLATLTLNLGLRYEPVSVPTETANRLAILRNLTDSSPHLGSPYFSNPSLLNFAPRVGFVWDPFGSDKTSIRGGFGIYDSLPLNYLFEGLSIFTAPFLELGNVATLTQGAFPKSAYPLLTASGLRYSYAQPNPHRSYVEQYSLNVQRDLGGDFILQVGYQGSHGVHLPYREDDINTVLPSSTIGGYFFYGPSGTQSPSAAVLNGRKLNPNIGQISAMLLTGFSKYNALQTSLTKRLSNRTQGQLSYTWARGMDDGSSSTFGDTFANSVSSLPYWAPDRRVAISDFNISQVVVLSYLFQLPDPVKPQKAAGFLLNGWQWGGIFQATTGEPFTPLISGDPLNLKSADVFAFPDRLRGAGCQGNPVHSFTVTKRQYLNPQCFAYPSFDPVSGLTHLGTSPRNSVIGPGLAEFDTSLVKNTAVPRISETFNVQFRAEFFNLLNRVNYAVPPKSGTFVFAQAPAPVNGVPVSQNQTPLTTAGVLVGPTATSSRQIQFGLKVIF